jgi:phospholipase/carboxylesterase
MSGFIPTVDGWEPELASRRGLPVFITHGARDPVISVEFARDARARLEAAGLDVDYHEHGGAHHLDPRTIPLMTDWVAQRVAQFA